MTNPGNERSKSYFDFHEGAHIETKEREKIVENCYNRVDQVEYLSTERFHHHRPLSLSRSIHDQLIYAISRSHCKGRPTYYYSTVKIEAPGRKGDTGVPVIGQASYTGPTT